MFEFLCQDPAMESNVIESIKKKLGIRPAPKVRSLTSEEIKVYRKILTKIRNEYLDKEFPKIKSNYSEFFKTNPKAIIGTKINDEDYEFVQVTHRDLNEVTDPLGKKNSARTLAMSNYSDVKDSQEADRIMDEFEKICKEVEDDIRSFAKSKLPDNIKFEVYDDGDWDDGGIAIVITGVTEVATESYSPTNELSSIMMEATAEDRAKFDRENSIKDASNGIVELIKSHGMESWFSSDEDKESSKIVNTNGYPKIEFICKGIQSELKKVYKNLPGYKESQKLCKEEYDDILYMEFDKIELYDNSVYIVGFNQDGITKEYESSLKSFVNKYIDKIKSVYPDLDIIVDVNDDGTNLTIYFE